MNLEKTKKALIDFQKKHESYLEAAKQYQEYKNLPFWKKLLTMKVEAPRKNYLYRDFAVYYSTRRRFLIELRMYYSGSHKEITLVVNENNCGYKLNIATGEKSYYLGRVNPTISKSAEEILENVRKELSPLYVE